MTQDLAVQTICDFWFPGIALQSKKSAFDSSSIGSPANTADMMLEVVTTIPNSMDPLVRVMKEWAAEHSERANAEYSALLDYLNDSLVDGAEKSSSVSAPNDNVANCCG